MYGAGSSDWRNAEAFFTIPVPAFRMRLHCREVLIRPTPRFGTNFVVVATASVEFRSWRVYFVS